MTPPRPRPVVALAVSLALVALLTGCRAESVGAADGAGPAVDPGGRYMLLFSVDDVSGAFAVKANGFPLNRDPVLARSTDDELAVELTPALVSGLNAASVEVVPILARTGPDGRGLTAAPVRFGLEVFRGADDDGTGGAWLDETAVTADSTAALFEAYVSALRVRWAGWVASEDSLFAVDPSVRARYERALDDVDRAYGWGPALDSARAWVVRHPFEVATRFVRPGGAGRPSDGAPSFDAVFRDAPVIAGTPADSAALRAYAVRLRDLVAAGDGAALYDEFAPALRDNGALHGLPPLPDDTLRARWAAGPSGWAGGHPAPLAPSEVGLRSWAGGRVWELYRPGADGLLQGRDGGPYTEVYVGEVDGALRVVRQ